MRALAIIVSTVGVLAAFFFGYLSRPASHENPPALVHRSYLETREVFDQGFAEASQKTIPAEENVEGITVSHHLLATTLIAEAFLSARAMHPDTVIIVSPNHFDQGFGPFIISRENWSTPYGPLEADTALVDELVQAGASVQEKPFVTEHGISSIMPYVKKMFPDAKVVPIIVRENANNDDARAFGTRLAALAPGYTLLVASFDFSHEVTNTEAERSDKISVKAIQDFDYKALAGIRIDSHPGLVLSLAYLQARGGAFHLLESTNASHLLKLPDMTDVTSYIIGYFTGPK